MRIRIQLLGLLLLAWLPAQAAQVELQLVLHDQLETTVDKREHKNVITNPVSTSKGIEMKTIGVDVECWARNVLLDGKSVFERYHDGWLSR